MLGIILVIVVVVVSVLFLIQRYQDFKLLGTVTGSHRGNRSERRLILSLLRSGRSSNAVFHDLYVPRKNGTYSQIDAVLATSIGMIVFEVKDYSGWIFGDGRYENWTQVLSYGREKYRFYNPIRQNASHVKALKERLKHLGDIPCISVVVFYGNCELKRITNLPEDTWVASASRVFEVISEIEEYYPEIRFKDKWQVVRVLDQAVSLGDQKEIRQKHRKDVAEYVKKKRYPN